MRMFLLSLLFVAIVFAQSDSDLSQVDVNPSIDTTPVDLNAEADEPQSLPTPFLDSTTFPINELGNFLNQLQGAKDELESIRPSLDDDLDSIRPPAPQFPQPDFFNFIPPVQQFHPQLMSFPLHFHHPAMPMFNLGPLPQMMPFAQPSILGPFHIPHLHHHHFMPQLIQLPTQGPRFQLEELDMPIPHPARPSPELVAELLAKALDQSNDETEKLFDLPAPTPSRRPFILSIDQRDGFFVVSGFFPGVKKSDLKLRIEGNNLIVDGVVSDKSEKSERAMEEFANIDAVNERMELPYAPDSRVVKAHFEESDNELTVVFPVEQSFEITIA